MSLNRKKELSTISKEISRSLRKKATEAENILWNILKSRQLANKKFLRQHPFFYDLNGTESFFIADFYCAEKGLIIELDGEYHKYRLTEDAQRTEILQQLGLRILRFTNEAVNDSLDYVVKSILDALE